MARSQLATAVLALADRLAAETEVAARIALIDALSAIATKRGVEVAEAHRRRAVSAVLDNLGQVGCRSTSRRSTTSSRCAAWTRCPG
jgi:hypothetical protein